MLSILKHTMIFSLNSKILNIQLPKTVTHRRFRSPHFRLTPTRGSNTKMPKLVLNYPSVKVIERNITLKNFQKMLWVV